MPTTRGIDAMSRPRLYNFHDVRLSLIQSCIREVICKGIEGGSGPGLWGGHPILRSVSAVLQRIHDASVTDAAAARVAYRAERAGQAAPPAVGTVGTASDCLDLLAEYTLAWFFQDLSALAEIRGEFIDSSCDPGWMTALVSWIEYYGDGRAPEYRPPQGDAPAPISLPAPASADGMLRVGVLGDWGTGEPEAIAVLDQLMQQAPDVILHVGDIYYAGTPEECQSNFLGPINEARAKYGPIPVYTLAGNHDYYSGGAGYYGMIGQLNENIPDATIQANSFFCLRNENWQLQGMDTGYNDHDLLKVAEDVTWLQKAEVAWHTGQIAAAGGRRVILFSHHQLFSAFQTIGSGYTNPYLSSNLQVWRAAGRSNIVAWLWGHEHLLEVYADPGQGGATLPVVGRCIGHGAFPVFNDQDLYNPKTDEIPLLPTPEPPHYIQTGDDGLIYDRGYALLTLGDASGTATYYQVVIPPGASSASSQALWTEPISVAPPR